jgi:predicted  nucleic acid-binding Zn-ribbon protein
MFNQITQELQKEAKQYVALLNLILKEITKMSTQLDTLTSQVSANTDAVESAITLLNNISAELKAAGTDPVKLQALADTLKQEDDKLAQAVVANTPAA